MHVQAPEMAIRQVGAIDLAHMGWKSCLPHLAVAMFEAVYLALIGSSGLPGKMVP